MPDDILKSYQKFDKINFRTAEVHQRLIFVTDLSHFRQDSIRFSRRFVNNTSNHIDHFEASLIKYSRHGQSVARAALGPFSVMWKSNMQHIPRQF